MLVCICLSKMSFIEISAAADIHLFSRLFRSFENGAGTVQMFSYNSQVIMHRYMFTYPGYLVTFMFNGGILQL